MIPIRDIQILINSMVLKDLVQALRQGILTHPGRSSLYKPQHVNGLPAPTVVRVYCDLWKISKETRDILLERVES